MFEWTFTAGNLATLSVLLAVTATVLRFGNSLVKNMIALGRYMERLDAFIIQQEKINDKRDLQFSTMTISISEMAVQKIRLDNHEKWIDELRHGIGVILPPDKKLTYPP